MRAIRPLLSLVLLALATSLWAQQTTDAPRKPDIAFQLNGATKHLFKEAGKYQLHLHTFLPADWSQNDQRSAIVFFFGGGWVGGTPAQFEPQSQYLAQRGMVAIAAEYRVSSRHGVHPAECVADAKDAVRWVREHARELGIDAARIAVAGGSAGGHVAAATATLEKLPEEQASKVSCVPNALILFNPVCDTTQLGYGGSRLQGRAYELSPVHHLRPHMPPTLIFHGEADTTVPYENAVRFKRLMDAAGNACELVGYPDAGHGFFNQGRANSQYEDTTRRLDDFLTKIGFITPANADTKVAGRSLSEWIAELDGDVTTRRRAAKTIGLFGAEADGVLVDLLIDYDPAVRYDAASSIGDRQGPPLAKPELLALLKREQSRGVRAAVAYALCRLGDTATGLPILTETMLVDERGAACSAAEFLGRVGAPASGLVGLMQQEHDKQNVQGGDYHIRGAIKNALRKITLDDSLQHSTRPTGGGNPRGWQPSDKADAGGSRLTKRPNILWISCEDISPNLRCYGDAYASTPNLDQLATQGARFDRAFTPAGVCAVIRSGIIAGVYPISLGSQHMRSNIVPAEHVKCFTEYLRGAGYFCTNKSKTDYQFAPPRTAWDRQGNSHDDWRDRAPDQPFFSVINLTITHESQIRHGEQTHARVLERLQPEQRHDPDKAGEFLPPIHPNTPEARKDWAWYADNISEMDRQAGLVLKQLEEDGLADNTVVVFWGDHGRGLPRGKRWIYESGVHIPLIVRWPGHVQARSVREDLVSTQDFASTMLALAGVDRPAYLQGRVFLGEQAQPEPEFLFYHRDRMDEAYELMRAARDRRFKYIRNYQPAKTYAQHVDYMDKMPTLVDLRRMHRDGETTQAQSRFFVQGKPLEELYDLEKDPHETVNLAWLPEHAARVAKMRNAVEDWQSEIVDLGMVPEPVMMEQMRPNDVMRITKVPSIAFEMVKGELVMKLASATPGASLQYRDTTVGGDDSWKLYTRPTKVMLGANIEAMACRIGYEDSEVAQKNAPND